MKRSPFNHSSADAGLRDDATPAEERLDPAIQAELDQLDAALRGDPIEDDALADLVRDIQATAPEMPGDLRKQLRHDVASGFARRGVRGRVSAALGRTGTRNADGPRNFKLLTGGSVAAVAAAGVFAVVAINAGTGSDDYAASDIATTTDERNSAGSAAGAYGAAPTDDSAGATEPLSGSSGSSPIPSGTSSKASERAAARSVSPEQQALVDKTLQAPSGGAADQDAAALLKGSTPATGQRRVEQSVDMTVRVKSGEIDDASQKVESIVRQGDGYVADSRVSIGTRGSGDAAFELKVASSKLDATMKRLGDLGTVTSQQQASRDITSSFDTTQRRLEDNAELRKALLRSLAKADTDGEIASLKRRLADNRSSRATLERQLAQLRTRTNLTTIAFTLNAPSGDAADEDDDGTWSIGDALSDAGRALGAVTGVLLVGGAVLLPFALLGAAGWAVYRVRRKRRRESALDA